MRASASQKRASDRDGDRPWRRWRYHRAVSEPANAASELRLCADGDWIEGARRVLSPNRDERPAGTTIDLLVVHGISLPPGEFGGRDVERLFSNTLDPDAHPFFAGIAGLRVSAHALVRRDGGLVQFVPFRDRAWHAGVSRFDGRERCNDYSIGIELEGTDETPYAPAQYATLAGLAAALMLRHRGITAERVVGHADVAPGRKTDPGPAFDWPRARAAIAAELRRRTR